MPYIKVTTRKRRRIVQDSEITANLRISLIIILISVAIGWVAVSYMNSLNKDAAPLTGPGGIASGGGDNKAGMISDFKEQHGDDWKSKLKEQYADQIGQMDEATKQELRNKYKDQMK